MQVRGRGGAGITDGAYLLAFDDGIADFHVDFVHVCVESFVAESVVYDDIAAVSGASFFNADHLTVACGSDGSALRRGEVDTGVHFAHFMDGVDAVSET